jgi:hypothetical protein
MSMQPPPDVIETSGPSKLIMSLRDGLFWVLLCISGFATYDGLMGVMVEGSGGELDFTSRIFVIVVVATIFGIMKYILQSLSNPRGLRMTTLFYGAYALLTLVTVTLGFSFFWKHMQMRNAIATNDREKIEAAMADVGLASVATKSVERSLMAVAGYSATRAADEDKNGGTCAPAKASGKGKGPVMAMRQADADYFKASAEQVAIGTKELEEKLEELRVLKKNLRDGVMAPQAKPGDPQVTAGTARKRDQARFADNRDEVIAVINSYNGLQSNLVATWKPELEARLAKTEFPDSLAQPVPQAAAGKGKTPVAAASGATFSCPDSTLSNVLRSAIRDLENMRPIKRPEPGIDNDGKAVIAAFYRLTHTLGVDDPLAIPASFVGWADRLFSAKPVEAAKKEARQQVDAGAPKAGAKIGDEVKEGLHKEDYLPLGVALLVDVFLLMLALDAPTDPVRNASVKLAVDSLSRYINVHEFFSHYVVKHRGVFYVGIPNNSRTVDGKPTKDSMMRTAFFGLEDQNLMREIWSPFMNLQKMLENQGRPKIADGGMTKYRMHKNIVPILIRAMEEADSGARPGGKAGAEVIVNVPQPGRNTRDQFARPPLAGKPNSFATKRPVPEEKAAEGPAAAGAAKSARPSSKPSDVDA